jgi:hypothetical protein
VPANHGDVVYKVQGSGVSSFTVTKPANTVNGSVLLAFQNIDAGSLASMSTPTGGSTWNLLGSGLLTGTAGTKVWWKVCGASEPASYTFNTNTSADNLVTLLRPNDVDNTVTPVLGTYVGDNTTGTTIGTPGLTPAGTTDLEYRLASGIGGSAGISWSIAASTPTFTALTNQQSNTFTVHRVFYRQLTSGSATGSVTATSSASQGNRQGVSVALKSSGATTVTGAAALSAEGTSSIAAKVEVHAAVALAGDGALTAAYEVPKVFGAAALSAQGALTVSGRSDVKGILALAAEATLNVSGSVQAPPIIDPPLFPHNTVEIQFVDGVWTDVTPYFRGATVSRGSSKVDSPVLRYEAGTAEIALDNRDRRFDPTNLSGPYVENFSTDTGDQEFTASETFTFGHAVSIAVKSAAGQDASIINVTSKASGTTASYTCTKPTGTVSGKRMIAVASADIGLDTDLTITGGTSWGTPILSRSSGEGTIQTRVWSKIAGGSEPSSYTLGQSSGADGICAIAVLDGADTSTAPIATAVDQPERKLFVAPGATLFGTNDLDMRWCAGNGSGTSGVSWQSPTSEGFTEYADKQSQSYTSGVLAARPLTDFGGIGTETQVIPMRPIRIRSLWTFEDPTTNLVENPSFEDSTSDWQAITAETAIARSDAFSYSGGQSLRISRNATNSPFFLYGPQLNGTGIAAGTAGGQTVTLSAYVYIPSASFPKVTSINFGIGGTANGFVNMPPAADGWYRLQRTVVLSGAATNVQIQFWTDDTHGDGQVVAYVDAVQLEIKPLATTYVDGSKPGCTWSGTANNSSSTRPTSKLFDVFNGFIDDWLIDWEADYESQVTLPCTDGFVVLADHDRVALGSAVGANELTGARVTRILDSVGWDVTKRTIATGNTQVQGTTLEGDALTELFLTTDTEIGEFYQDAAGNMVFRNRQALMTDTRSVQNQARFGDGGDTMGEIPYHHVSITNESTQFVNEVRIAREGGVQQVVEDAASKAKYKRTRVHERTDLQMTSDGEALAHASWILYISSTPELRFDEITIRPQKDEGILFPQVLAREIGDRILIRRRPPNNGETSGNVGEVLEKEVFVRGITHEIGQWFWETKFSLQSASKVGNFLTLNHPELGRIGRNALVY